MDGAGNLYVADSANHRIRSLTRSSLPPPPPLPITLQAPTGLTATAVSSSQIDLTWQDNSANETGFQVQRRVAGSTNWVQIATTATNATAFSNTGLQPNTTYHYRVQAFNATESSAFSNQAMATTPASITLQAPTGLTATAVSSSQIDLTWQDNSTNETGFQVQRRVASSTNWVQIATTATNATTFSNTGLQPNTTYHYRVQAFNATESSAFSNQAMATTPASITLQAPTGLTATAVSSSQIDLTWQDNSTNETGFQVQRRVASSTNWVQIATTATNATTFSNTGLQPNTTYHYRVQAFNDTESSAFSNQAMATTPEVPPPTGTDWIIDTIAGHGVGDGGPAVQAQLAFPVGIAVDGAGNLYFADRWNHRIRRVDAATGTISTFAGTGTFGFSRDGGPAVAARLHDPTGVAVDGNGNLYVADNDNHRIRILTRSSSPPPPSPTTLQAPTGLTATAVSSSQIDLAWQDNSTNETGFRVQHRVAGSTAWVQIATTAANATAFSNTGLQPNTTYHYRVQAFNATESSAFSNQAMATTPALPPTGSGIRSRLFVPIVLRSRGRAGAFFTSELTLTNRGSRDAAISYTYTASIGSGSGTATDSLGAGQQRVIPDAMAYLASLGVPIGEGAAGGTLGVEFSNLSSASDAAITVRVGTPVEEGRAGLAYPGLRAESLLSGPAWLAGLRQNQRDRSNVAVQNAGEASQGNITLRVTVFSGDPAAPGSFVLPEVTLAPGGFH